MTTSELLYLLAGLVVGWIVRGPFRPTRLPGPPFAIDNKIVVDTGDDWTVLPVLMLD